MQPISNNSSQQVIRCLMLGQAGIGKTAFLRHLPNAMQDTGVNKEIIKSTETYSVETIDSKFDKVRIDIECCDLDIQTCLHDTDLIVNNKILPSSSTPSNQFINTSKFDVIILCFAFHEPSSFQLVKCKWAVDLEKNKKNKHSFVLLGLDNKQNKKPATDGKIMATFKKLSPKTKQKQDMYESIESTGSISNVTKMQPNEMAGDDECIFLDDDLFANMQAPTNYTTAQYKKFAKLISFSSQNFVQHQTETNIHKANVLLLPEIISSQLASYEKFIQTVVKSYESLVELRRNSDNHGGLVGKLKRSVTAPLARPLNILSRNRTKLSEKNNHKESLVIGNKSLSSEKTVKEKVTRFAINLGTFLVTCGTVKSREMQKLKNEMRILERDSDENYAYYYSSNSSLDNEDSSKAEPSTQIVNTSEFETKVNKSNNQKKNIKVARKLFKRNRTWQPLTMSGSQLTLNNNSLEDLVIRDD